LSDKNSPPTLTDPTGMGGVIAQEGFDYQYWDGLSRLPAWLRNPAFEHLLFEGLEDLEARFFAPHAPEGHVLERYQSKGSSLTPGQVREVLESFLKFETAFPNIARVQTLVTPKLPKTVEWLGRNPERVRKARPFYAPFTEISKASDRQLVDRHVKEYGAPLGEFIFKSVEVSEKTFSDHDQAAVAFAHALELVFPELDVVSRQARQAFDSLLGLIRRNVGAPLRREVLRGAIEASLGKSLPLGDAFPLRIRSDRNASDENALEIDASAFSGGDRPFPDEALWRHDLLKPLDRTSKWLRGQSISRVRVTGSYRLTSAICIGWALRSAIGLELEVETRDGIWATNERPAPGIGSLASTIAKPERLDGDQLNVAIGILRNPASDLQSTAGRASETVLSFHLPTAIASAHDAQAGVGMVKQAIDEAVQRMRPATINLYFAGPAAFAVALGHRWNALPRTQLHEFQSSSGRYIPTALIA